MASAEISGEKDPLPLVNAGMARGDPIIAIRFPEDGDIRARKVVSRSRARPTGKYPSWKMGRMIQWESHHELTAMRLLDADPTVSSFSEQPLEIEFIMDGVVRRHYPDILVYRGGVAELWEIKSNKNTLDEETARRGRLLTGSLGVYGFQYHMVFGSDMSSGPQLSNALMLLRHGRSDMGATDCERARLLFSQNQSVTWGQVVAGILGDRGRQLICRLILEGVVGFDSKSLFGNHSTLHWIGGSFKRGRL